MVSYMEGGIACDADDDEEARWRGYQDRMVVKVMKKVRLMAMGGRKAGEWNGR
ncbi:hypothetical protein TWF481_005077 [Arthrobotrys musiformis]|uniref:Uncharacterized protein n=1 Tax=Arthrobotrys musiformis TaxID=47236 RepID=A0AAV9WEV2_9PEZI